MQEIEQWLIEVSSGQTLRQVAIDAGISIPTLSRQVRESSLTPENVVRIARHYGRSPLSGLVAIGLLTEEEAARVNPEDLIKHVQWDDLMREMIRRSRNVPELNQPMQDFQ